MKIMSKVKFIVLSLILITSLVVGRSPIPSNTAFAASDFSTIEVTEQNYSSDNEVIERRTENSKTYYGSDGRYRCEISSGAIHYKNNYADESEGWKDIDLTIKDDKLTTAPYELTTDGKKITLRIKKQMKFLHLNY